MSMSPASENENPILLNDRDAAVLDALAEAGYDPAAVDQLAPEDQTRARRLLALLNLLDQDPVADGEDFNDHTLIHATLARIDQYEERQAERMRIGTGEDRRFAFRIGDLVGVAAALLLCFAILWPSLRNDATDTSVRLGETVTAGAGSPVFGQWLRSTSGQVFEESGAMLPSFDEAIATTSDELRAVLPPLRNFSNERGSILPVGSRGRAGSGRELDHADRLDSPPRSRDEQPARPGPLREVSHSSDMGLRTGMSAPDIRFAAPPKHFSNIAEQLTSRRRLISCAARH